MALDSKQATIPFSFDHKKAVQLAAQHELDLAFTKPSRNGLESLDEFQALKDIFPSRKSYNATEFKEKLALIDAMQEAIKDANMSAKKKEALDYLYNLVKLQMMRAFYKAITNKQTLEEEKVEPLAGFFKRFKCYLFSGFAVTAEGTDGFFGVNDFFSSIFKITNTILNIGISIIGFCLKAFAYSAVEIAGFTEEMGCSKKAILPRFIIHEMMLKASQAINDKLSRENRTSASILSVTQLFGISILFSKIMSRNNATVNSYKESNTTKNARLWVGRACAVIDGVFSFVVVKNFFLMLGLALSWSPAGWGILLGCLVTATVTAYLEYKSSMPLGFFKFFNPYAEMQDRLKNQISSFEDPKNNEHNTKDWKFNQINSVIKEDINAELEKLNIWLSSFETFDKVESNRINESIDSIFLKVKEVENQFNFSPLDFASPVFELKKSLKALVDLSLEVKCNNIQLKINALKNSLNPSSDAIESLKRVSESLLSMETVLWREDKFFHLEQMKFTNAKERISKELDFLKTNLSAESEQKSNHRTEKKDEAISSPFYSCTSTTSHLFQLKKKQEMQVKRSSLGFKLE